METTTLNNKTIIENMYNNMATGNIPALKEQFAGTIEWTATAGSPFAGTYTTIDNVLETILGPIMEMVDGFTVTPTKYVMEGDNVCVLATYTGTVKETGKEFTVRVAHSWTLNNGLIVAYEQFLDTATMNAAFN